ncbi:MAG TPA: outer membrane protein assembly factor BamD [Blastocatellia bacterium]|nr:outer membrane protein assembly factor BamD [Blastocatellia bacterium]
MRRREFIAVIAAGVGMVRATLVGAMQRTPVVPAVDPELEAFSKHNLEVARLYFKKKAWKGVANRLEEVAATYPEFTKIDEVYYLLGVSYIKLEKIDDARDILKKLIDVRPDSDYAKKARTELADLDKP